MANIVDENFKRWTRSKNELKARINIYEKVRDIPYAVIPELNDARRYVEIFQYGRGSCTPKHLLLGNMFERLGMLVLYTVHSFRWDEAQISYPPSLKKLAERLPTSYHLACRVEIEGKLVLIDATLDPSLQKLGLPVNLKWDGISDTVLPITSCGDEQIYHPSEACMMQAQYDTKSLIFYDELNKWLEEVRNL